MNTGGGMETGSTSLVPQSQCLLEWDPGFHECQMDIFADHRTVPLDQPPLPPGGLRTRKYLSSSWPHLEVWATVRQTEKSLRSQAGRP